MWNRHFYINTRLSTHTCQPREKFSRYKRGPTGPTERSEPASEGGSGGLPPEIFKKLYCKWCNLSYSWAILVNTRRVPVQRAVKRDEIPYPYNVHDTTLLPLLNITIKSTIVVPFEVVQRWRHLRDNSRIQIGCKHRNCGDSKFVLI